MNRTVKFKPRWSQSSPLPLRRLGFLLVALAALLIALFPFITALSNYDLNLFMQSATYAIATLGLVILLGFTGQISLAQAAFFAIGAYSLGLGTTVWHLSFWEALAVGLLASALAGLLLGLTTLRLGGHYLAMVTISFGVVLDLVLVNAVSFTQGPDGVTGIPRPSLFGYTLTSNRSYLLFSLVLLYLAGLGVYLLRTSVLGRGMRAVRDNELAAEVVGVRSVQVKVISFVLGSTLGGLGGALYAAGFSYISPDAFTFTASVVFLTMAVVGGAASALGGIFGTGLLILLPEVLRFLKTWYLIVYGAVVILVVVFMPDGIFGSLYHLVSRQSAGRDLGPVLSLEESMGRHDPRPATGDRTLLKVTGLKKHFGGVKAVDGLDLEVEEGTVHALIGPNGSGKTTALNVISGIYRPTSGEVYLGGQRMTGWRPHRMARQGLARTFQLIRLCESMTALENVIVGAQVHLGRKGGRSSLRARALAALGFVGLAEQAGSWARQLPYGLQRKVEIARAVASNPRLLLLDEPAAGLNSTEKSELVELLRELVRLGVTILVIEHDMGLIESVADRLTVLNFGKKIAEGTPVEVLSKPEVIAAYLGDRGAGVVA